MAARIKDDPKKFWKYTNSRMKTKPGVGDLKDDNGGLATDDGVKASILNKFFSSVYTEEDLATVPRPPVHCGDTQLDRIVITDEMVRGKLEKLKTSSSPGPDGIHPRILRETARSIASPLANVFQKSLACGRLPQDWKLGSVTPIFKKGDRSLPGNYRPVSLTSVPCKVLESLIRDQLVEHLSATGQLSKDQHGFRAKRSCTSQLLEVLEEWTTTMENGDPLDAVYLDFRKAFDSVPHQRLLNKLRACGVAGKVLDWIQSFLTGRHQQVIIGGHKSPWSPVLSGVPQGSVLGPTLFIAFVNDMPNVVDSSIKIFADDTKLFRKVPTTQDRRLLQNDLDAIAEWSKTWQLPFNEEKCTVLHIGSRNPRYTYTLNDLQLNETDSERDLGVYVDNDLKFRKQAASAVAKASQVLALIRKSFRAINCDTLPLLFKSLVRPHLEYGCCIWGPFSKADRKAVERVQRRATKLVPDLRHRPYTERLRLLDLPSLYYRRRRGDMIKTYQVLHGEMDVRQEDFFTPALDRRTRGHPWKLNKEQAQSRTRRLCFSTRVISDWNSLPPEVVLAPSLGAFKSRLDAHWDGIRYQIPD